MKILIDLTSFKNKIHNFQANCYAMLYICMFPYTKRGQMISRLVIKTYI